MRVCAPSTINNYCVHVNCYCLRKQLALVRIPQASKQLIVTLKVHVLCRWGEGGTQLSWKPFLVVSFQVLEFQMFVRLKITAHWSGQRMHAGNVFFCLGPLLPALPSVYQWHWRHSSDKKDQAFPLYNRWTKSPCEWFFHKMEQSKRENTKWLHDEQATSEMLLSHKVFHLTAGFLAWDSSLHLLA